MKCLSSIPVLVRKVLQKPCCVFFTVLFWPARVFCMAGYCHVALKFCIKPRQKAKDCNGEEGGEAESPWPECSRATRYQPSIHFQGSCVIGCVETQDQSTAAGRPQFTFHTAPWVHSHKVNNRICRGAKPFVRALAVGLRAVQVPSAGSGTSPGCQPEGSNTAQVHWPARGAKTLLLSWWGSPETFALVS